MSEMSTDDLFNAIGEGLNWVGDIFLKVERLADRPGEFQQFDIVTKIRELGTDGELSEKTQEQVVERTRKEMISHICDKMDIYNLETLEEYLVERDIDTDKINEIAKQLEPYLEFELIEADVLNDVKEATQDAVLVEAALATVEENVVVDEIEEKDLEDMNKSELKEIAEELGLPKTGTKKQLIKKIEEHIEESEKGEELDHYEIGDIDEYLQFGEEYDKDEDEDEHVHDENCNHENGCDEDCMHKHTHDDPTYHPQENMGEVTVEVEENHSLTQIDVKGKTETFDEQVRMWSLLAEFWDDDIDILKHVKEETTGQLLFERMTNLIESGKVSTKAEFFTGIGLMFEMKPKDVVKLFTLLENLE